MSVQMRAHRILKHLVNYHEANENLPIYLLNLELKPYELVLGYYENTRGKIDECVVVTNIRLLEYMDGKWNSFSYDEIKDARKPKNVEKLDFQEIEIELIDGRCIYIPVKGGGRRSRDAFEFLRFLDRIMEDIYSEENK